MNQRGERGTVHDLRQVVCREPDAGHRNSRSLPPLKYYAPKDVPQPQVCTALGLVN
jgi:hypothetical protein